MNKAKPTFALTLQAVPGSDVPAIIRLRRFLKAALRGYGLRCIRAEEIHPETDSQRVYVLCGLNSGTTPAAGGEVPFAPTPQTGPRNGRAGLVRHPRQTP